MPPKGTCSSPSCLFSSYGHTAIAATASRRVTGHTGVTHPVMAMTGTEDGPEGALEQFRFHFIAGHGGYPPVGTPEQVVDGLQTLADIGVDGCLISWVNYKDELRQWIDEVMPLMVETGLRLPAS